MTKITKPVSAFCKVSVFWVFCAFCVLPPLTAQEAKAGSETEFTEDEFFPEDELPLMEGEGLSVVASREKNQQVAEISKEEIENAHAPDIPSLLESVLGLNVARNGPYGNQASVNIRGSGGGRVAILIDGVPVNSTQSGSFDLGKLNLSSIEKIEVISGGSDTKYNLNGAVGGVINIITVPKKADGAGAGISFSNLSYIPSETAQGLADSQQGTIDFSLGNGQKYWKLSLSGHRAGNEFPYKDAQGETNWRKNNEIIDGNATTVLSLPLRDTLRAILSVTGYIGDKNIPGPVNTNTHGDQRDWFTQSSVLLDADRVGSDTLNAELSLAHLFNSIAWKDTSLDSLHELHTYTLINRWNWYGTPWLSLSAGGDLEVSLLSSTEIGQKQDANGGIYLTAELTAGKKWTILPSVKMVRAGSFLLPVPKLAVVYRANEYLTLKNNYFRTFKLPTLNDLYWPTDDYAEGNPDLKNEDGFGGDFIVTYTPNKRTSVETSLYATGQKDAILWQTGSLRWRPENIGEAMFFGSDTSIVHNFADWARLAINYKFLLTYILTDGATYRDNLRLPYQPIHTLTGNFTLQNKTSSLSFLERYESERYTTTLNVNRLPAIFTMDILANHQLNDKTSLFCTIRNLSGESRFSIDGYPMPGTSVTLGARLLGRSIKFLP